MWSTGTGKTVVATGLLKDHLQSTSVDVAFFVVKAHNKINTQRTLERLASIESVVLDGPKKRREKLLTGLLEAPPGTVIVTNYEKFRVDHDLLVPLVEDRNVLIIWDEMPTKLKNRDSQIYEAVTKLLYTSKFPNWEKRRPAQLRQYMLSATPIENDPEDFFNCMRLLDPRIFGNVKSFYKQFVAKYSYFDQYKPETWHNLEKMGLIASHVVHQVDKEDPDIANQFPKVLEENFYIDWDETDWSIYSKLSKAAKKKFAERDEFEEDGILALISVMQMLCDAPTMVNNSAALREAYNSLIEELGPESPDFMGKKGSKAALELLKLVGEKLTDERHTKLDTLRTLLTETHKDEKVVLFTTFNQTLMPILTSKFDEWGVTYVTYTGGIKEKQNSQDKFLSDPKVQVFLSSDAGSDSINLEVASVVIHYDLPWKYSTLIQRQNRIHRVTSDFDKVRYYTLLMANSIEERKLKIIQKKHEFHQAVFKGAVAEQATSARMSREDLLFILGG
jgi:SNF2 family DNA or RNA helicase